MTSGDGNTDRKGDALDFSSRLGVGSLRRANIRSKHTENAALHKS